MLLIKVIKKTKSSSSKYEIKYLKENYLFSTDIGIEVSKFLLK